MRVQVGPVESHGVIAWIGYARGVLASLETGDAAPGAAALDRSVVESFEGFLADWHETATSSEEFVWIAELDPEQIEFLTYAFHNVVVGLATAAEARGYPEAPAESDEFYQALVESFLYALQTEGKVTAAFAEQMRATWPGLRPS